MTKRLLMGNEAFAHAALEAGARVIAGYPGTPSSELIETVASLGRKGLAEDVHVEWSTNEKAALEVAFAASLAGSRALFTCKQVGLNVASDALMSLNYVGTRAGLVLFVADDPGPISSQTEQDTRRFAAFAKLPVLDPATPEQGFLMMKEAFDLSERYNTPVIVRPTTRINHASTYIDVKDRTCSKKPEDGGFSRDPEKYVIFPKRSFEAHGQINDRLRAIEGEYAKNEVLASFNGTITGPSADLPFQNAEVDGCAGDGKASVKTALGIVAGSVTVQYALEALDLIEKAATGAKIAMPKYSFLQIGCPYPFPKEIVSGFLEDVGDVLVLEELDSVIEDGMLSICGTDADAHRIFGKYGGHTQDRGENSTQGCAKDIARFFDAHLNGSSAHGESTINDSPMQEEPSIDDPVPDTESGSGKASTFEGLVEDMIGEGALLKCDIALPARPPILCAGCPHRASFHAVNCALKKLGIGRDDAIFCGDIGCYTLGNTLPLDAVDTCLCMGAGFTMAQGFAASDPSKKAIAFIGDSTFFASGMTGVANAVYNGHDATFCILDNSTTAMTGMQPHPGTGVRLTGDRTEPISIKGVLEAMGVRKIVIADPLERDTAMDEIAEALTFTGPSAVILKSPCVWLGKSDSGACVDTDECTGCRKCIAELGCPAIRFDDTASGAKSGERGQARIDASQCNGCMLCAQVCPFSAIGRMENGEGAQMVGVMGK